jgi:hypothetical protein
MRRCTRRMSATSSSFWRIAAQYATPVPSPRSSSNGRCGHMCWRTTGWRGRPGLEVLQAADVLVPGTTVRSTTPTPLRASWTATRSRGGVKKGVRRAVWISAGLLDLRAGTGQGAPLAHPPAGALHRRKARFAPPRHTLLPAAAGPFYSVGHFQSSSCTPCQACQWI